MMLIVDISLTSCQGPREATRMTTNTSNIIRRLCMCISMCISMWFYNVREATRMTTNTDIYTHIHVLSAGAIAIYIYIYIYVHMYTIYI